MTKKDLEEMTKYTPRNQEEAMFIEAIIQFLDSNVCIPKGKNRVKFADELHLMLEGIETEMQLDGFIPWVRCDIKNIRIKPSEPVYLYRFTYQDYDGTVGISDYLSEKDAIISLVDVSNVSKLEWTKRVHNA